MIKRIKMLSAIMLIFCLLFTSCSNAPAERGIVSALESNSAVMVNEAKADTVKSITNTSTAKSMTNLAATVPTAKLTGDLTGATSPQIPIRKEDLIKKPQTLPSVTQKAIKSGIKPGSFQNVTAKLKPNVVSMDDKAYGKLTAAMTDNRLDKTRFGMDTTKIYVSTANGIAVKFMEDKASSNIYALRPGFSEVVDSFNIPEQTVNLNTANISALTEGISVQAVKVPKNYELQMPQEKGAKAPPPPKAGGTGEDALVLTFSERLYKGFSDTGSSVDFKISGSLELITPRIVGKYSKFSGYRLEFIAGEKFKLHSEAIITIDETFKIPIQEFSIPAQIGKARVGVYLVIDVNGEMRLVFDVDQGLKLNAGVKGGTFFYIPTSVNSIFNLERWCTLSSKFNGHLNAFVGPSAEVELEALGYDLLEVVARAGLETKIKVEGNDMDIKAGFRFKVYGEVVGCNFTAINNYVGFLDEKRRHTGVYEMKLTKACAYTDRIEGNIVKPIDLERSDPYKGDVLIKIVNESGQEKNRKTVTGDSKGNFIWIGANLYKGDKVYVLVPGSTDNWHGPLDVSFPFKEAEILYADYFGENMMATVAASNSKSSQQSVGEDGQKGIKGTLSSNDKGVLYSGAAKVVLTPYKPVTFTLSGIPVDTSGLNDVWDANREADIIVPVNISNGELKGGLNNNPLKPFMVAKLVIECRGFVLESKPVWTDGLMITPIKTEDYKLTPLKSSNREDISASNSFVIISGKRSSKTPQGKVKMYAGIDLPHRTEAYRETNMFDVYSQLLDVPMKQQLKNPLYYFDKEIALKSFKPSGTLVKSVDGKMKIDASNMSIAETGAWKVSSSAYNQEVRENDMKGDRHGFESISYMFEGVDLGYSNLELNCRFCMFGAGSYRWTDDTEWTSFGQRQFNITHGNIDINNLDGMGQIINNPGNPGVIDPGRIDIGVQHTTNRR